jgi:hypothetical protein
LFTVKTPTLAEDGVTETGDFTFETAYSGEFLTLDTAGSSLTVDTSAVDHTTVFMQATSRGLVQSLVKSVTVAVCQLPALSMADGDEINKDYGANTGDAVDTFEYV